MCHGALGLAAGDLGPALQPFASAAEAWFWFVACYQAQLDGARFTAGLGAVQRPCEPGDILRLTTRLQRAGRLERRHLEVLVYYGRTRQAPDPLSPAGRRDLPIWEQALDRLENVLRSRGIVS